MVVKNELVNKNNDIHDDISDIIMEKEKTNMTDENKTEELDLNKLAELKAAVAAKKKAKESLAPAKPVVEKVKRSLEFGVLGTGQSGSRVASEFFKLGYKTVVMNTASQDLEHIEVPSDNKLLLAHGIGGAAKELDIGKEAAEAHREEINALVESKLDDVHAYVVCTSLGGGSGAGSVETVIDILSGSGKPIVVITVLPMTTDDAKTKENAIITLSRLAKLAQDHVVSNIIVVDNAKLETIYADVSHMDFFHVGNEAIVATLDKFNRFSAMPSHDKPLDSMEFAKILTDGEGLSIYGEMSILGSAEDNTVIAQAVMENLESGLLASGFNLDQTKYAGVIVAASETAWKSIPRGAIGYAVSVVQENCSGAGVFVGSYVDNSIDDSLVCVYSMFSGLGLPDGRVSQLRKEVDADKAKVKDRAKARNLNLTITNDAEQTMSAADEVKKKIAAKISKFGQNFASGNVRDFRKK